MERSINYSFQPAPRRWAREAPATAAEIEGPQLSFKLLLLFLLVLYSNVAVLYPQLDSVRPALVIAVFALVMMVIEIGQLRQPFKLMWPQSAMVIAFFGVCIISSPMAIWTKHAVEQTSDLGKIILVYLLLENVVTTEKRLRLVMFTLVLGGLFPAIGTVDHYRTGIFVEHTRAAWRGLFGNPNEDAYAILILIPIAWTLASRSRWLMRIALWAVIGIYLLAIYVTFSRSGMLGLFAVLGLIGWKQKSVAVRAGMVGVLIAGAVVGSMFWTRSSGDFKNIKEDTTVRQRLATFEAGGLMFINNPLLGVGPGDSMVAYPLYVPKEAHCGCQDQLVIHNSFIQILSETGILGFIPFMIFIFVSLYQAWKMEKGPLGPYAMALELSMWGFVVCSLAGGFSYTWWPYIIVGLIAAAKRITDSKPMGSVHAV